MRAGRAARACAVGFLASRALLALLASLALAGRSPAGEPLGCTALVSPGTDLQSVIDRLPEDGSSVTVCLGAGEFRLPGFVSIRRSGVRIRGAGESTVVRLAEGVQSPAFIIGEHRRRVPRRPISNVTIEALRLVGGGAGGSEKLADFPYVTNSVVTVRSGRKIQLRDLDVTGCRSACILTEHDTRDVSIERSRIHDATWDGISLNRTTRARLIGNDIRANTAAGITAEHLTDSRIEDNAIRDNRSHGVYLSDSYRNQFRGNRFVANTNAGVFLTCAVRHRDPGPVLCWDDSMSQDNVFEGNELERNRFGYIVAADAAASCKEPSVEANVSRGDRFEDNPPLEQDVAISGVCMRIEPRPAPSPPADALWRIVSTCVDEKKNGGYCACPAFARSCCGVETTPDADVVWALTRDFVAIRDMQMCGCPADLVAGLALPRTRVTGIEDPRRPEGIWPFAWKTALSRIPDEGSIALVLNPEDARTQNQMHVHMLRLRPEVRAALAERSPPGLAGTEVVPLGDLSAVFATVAARVGGEKALASHGILVTRHGTGWIAVVTDGTSPQAYTRNRCRN